MKSMLSILAVLALVGGVSTGVVLAGDAPAGDKPAATQAHAKGVAGKISKVDGNAITVTNKKGDTVVTLTDSTTITIDEATKTAADLKEGLYVKVKLDGDKAVKIAASTKAPEGKEGKAAK